MVNVGGLGLASGHGGVGHRGSMAVQLSQQAQWQSLLVSRVAHQDSTFGSLSSLSPSPLETNV